MKNKKTKKSIKDLFAFGGTAMNVDSPSQDLEQFKRITEDAIMGSMYDPTVMGLKGLGTTLTSTGMSMAMQGIDQDFGGLEGFIGQTREKLGGKPYINKILPGAQVTKAALGGVMGKNIEAEGKEVIEVPGGMPMELRGPSHENGGIDMTVPEGTEVYSKRLKGEDGKTFAARKKAREKEIMKISKLLEKNPTDKNLKKTLDKIKANNDALDKKDLSQMEFVKNFIEGPSQSQEEKFALGGYADGLPIPNFLQIPEWFIDPTKKGFNKKGVFTPNILAGLTSTQNYINNTADQPVNGVPPTVQPSALNEATTATTTNEQPKESFLNNLLGSTTPGDILGMAGNLYGAFGGLQNTLNQRAAETPEVNQFRDFGKEALKTIQGQYAFLDDSRDNQLQDLELSRTGTINRNNNSARSVNTLRALNLATDAQANDTKGQLQNQYAQQVLGVMGQEASQRNAMDQVVMTGETRRADNEVRNKDSFYSNMAKNIASVGAGVALTGKSLNDMKEREATLEILKNANPNFYVDAKGVIRSRITNAVATLEEVKAWEEQSKKVDEKKSKDKE